MSDKNLLYKPIILDLNNTSDEIQLDEYCKNSNTIIIDNIYSQLKELVKLRNPKQKLDEESYNAKIKEHLKNLPISKYGLWIYYPWSNKLIHTVFEKEFIEIRTVRNCYKITKEEQSVLQQKVIGIVGLSVGHAIALTMASERICGELRLADFDTLELSNLNRIKTGIDNLGLKKTIIAAREIAAIDPFIKIVCYHDGINDENILDFLTKDGKIDICIEECDGFYEKFNIRYKCKDLNIPVIMDTSDKGLIDVERFDLEPDRKIFHGLTNVTDLEKLRNLTTDQKIPYLYEIINEEGMSTRLRASLIEVDETITGWPQLSSAVTYGSGMTTDVTRRILLDQFKSSGRYSIDLEDLIKDEQNSSEENTHITQIDNNDFYNELVTIETSQKTIINKTQIEKIVSDAILAPSGGDSQPWKWISTNNNLFLFLDISRCSPYTDLNNWGAILSLGCATENLILSAKNSGFGISKEILNLENNDFGVKFTFLNAEDKNSEKIIDNQLYDAIKIRQTNRRNWEFKEFDKLHLEKLTNAVESLPNAKITFIENREDILKLTNIIAEGDLIRFLNKFLYEEMMSEIRWNKKDAIERPYGVELDLFDISSKDKIGFKIAGSWSVASFVKKIGGNALGDLSRKLLINSSALALITMPKLDNANFYNGGIALERFWLTAANNKIAIHPFAALCYFFIRLETNNIDFFSSSEINKLKNLKQRWDEILKVPSESAPLFFAKLSYAPITEYSQRLPLRQVLEFKL